MQKVIIGWLFVLATLFTHLSAGDSPRAVIIFDASGSMWGQIDGTPKITIAKDVLKNVVSKWNPQVELGLTVYGHRSKGDCNDIESIIPVGKVDKNAMISTVMSIQPKGKTPISRSMKKVADEIKYTEEKATIILISDGKETCDPDPCATAKALKAQGVDFVTHVIGFNVDKSTDRELECIATATGGEYFSAKNATALNDAMNTITKKVEKAKPAPKPKAKKLKNNLEISATEKEGGKWVKAYHRIYKVVDGEAEDRQLTAFSSYKKEPGVRQIPVGKYVVKSEYNEFRKTTPFEVKAGEVTKLNIVMGQTGKVEISATEKEGGKWIKAYHRIYKVVDGEVEDGLTTSFDSYKRKAGERQIPVGKYVVKSVYNELRKTTPFEVKAGETTKLHIIFGQFYIESKCPDMSEKVSYEVYASSGRLVIEESKPCNKKLKLTLEDGDYSVEAKIASGKKEVSFTLGRGKPNSLTIDLTNLDHKDEIEADSPEPTATGTTPEAKEALPTEEPKEQRIDDKEQMKQVTNLLNTLGGSVSEKDAKDLQKAGAMLKVLGGIIGASGKKAENTKESVENDKEFDEMEKDLDMYTK
ncbi:Von Willebrand factor type A domain protein [hydrothermal vent metagenome]|uniref:von Willebrand factor type A domain protein n=1 Tax=hydrothermal vent metagenome TaxID=652676 RepID=A0A1W1BUC0_9ZZZZ